MDAFNLRDKLEEYPHLLWPYFSGSREWLFTQVAAWAQSKSKGLSSKLLAVHGPASIGKSVFAMELCHRYYVHDVFSTHSLRALRVSRIEKRNLKRRVKVVRTAHEATRENHLSVLAFYFFNHAAGHRDAAHCVKSISAQLQQHLPEFRPAAVGVGAVSVAQLFRKLVVEPAGKVKAKARRVAVDGKVVVVVDAVDECEEFEELAQVVTEAKLPAWLGVVVTFRTRYGFTRFRSK